jgi:hypothetical protein
MEVLYQLSYPGGTINFSDDRSTGVTGIRQDAAELGG